jgi:hypothetical protein
MKVGQQLLKLVETLEFNYLKMLTMLTEDLCFKMDITPIVNQKQWKNGKRRNDGEETKQDCRH